MFSFQFLDQSRRELVANPTHTSRRDSTRQLSRVGGVCWALATSVAAADGTDGTDHDDCVQLILYGGCLY